MKSKGISSICYLQKRRQRSDAIKCSSSNFHSPFILAYVVVIATTATTIGGIVNVVTAFTGVHNSYSNGINLNCGSPILVRQIGRASCRERV